MLIVNDAHLCLAGRSSLEERCHYCKKPLAAYPLVMSDDAKQTVYHVTCVLELATDLLVDLAATDARQEENSSWRGRVEGRQS